MLKIIEIYKRNDDSIPVISNNHHSYLVELIAIKAIRESSLISIMNLLHIIFSFILILIFKNPSHLCYITNVLKLKTTNQTYCHNTNQPPDSVKP